MATFGDFAYTVVRGDTVSKLAIRFGTTVDAIVAANQIANPDLILVGQRLVIPVPAIASTVPATPEAQSPLQAVAAPGGEFGSTMWWIAGLGLFVAVKYGGLGKRKPARARARARSGSRRRRRR